MFMAAGRWRCGVSHRGASHARTYDCCHQQHQRDNEAEIFHAFFGEMLLLTKRSTREDNSLYRSSLAADWRLTPI